MLFSPLYISHLIIVIDFGLHSQQNSRNDEVVLSNGLHFIQSKIRALIFKEEIDALLKLYSLFPEPGITCPDLPVIPNAEPWPRNVDTQYGASYTARCLPGSAETSVSARCNERGTWDINGSCQSKYYITISCIFVVFVVILLPYSHK